jgi:threonine synthase
MFVTHLESPWDGTRFEKGQVLTLHAGRPLEVKYDLDAVRRAVRPDDICGRPPSLWRYRELLPLPGDAEPVTLGEGMSPLLPCPRLGTHLGLTNLWIKDESQLPTGSFKSRGMTTAISMAKQLGIRRIALPTAGNAGGAVAAYGARAGIDIVIFMPEDTPIVNQMEAYLCGAKVFLVNGLINDCGRIVREGIDKLGWFDCSTLKEPYRLEGKKTMGLELAEQRGWTLPDVILYPTGGGTGLIGMHKAFGELESLGWLRSSKRPRFISCQSDGCAPIVRAFEAGARTAELFPNAATRASGLRVPGAVGDFMMLDAIRQSGGFAVSAPDDAIPLWMKRVAQAEGVAICPETAICFAVLEKLIAKGQVRRDEEIVVFNTGAAQKYLEVVQLDLPRLDKNQPIDWSRFA